ncbi:Innexin-19 [Trichinella pseudospiralis]
MLFLPKNFIYIIRQGELFLYSIIVASVCTYHQYRQWIGQPIECWVPAEFKYAWEEYTENFCYIQDTYWLPLNDTIPGRSERGHKHISYYQWVPFILGVQALFFGAPFALWRVCNFRSGFNIETIVSVARESALKEPWDDESSQPASSPHFLLATGRQWMPNIFLRLLSGNGWELTGVFPRVTMCDFEVRVLGNLNRYTVQCVLMINMVNEKIFLLVWCWTVALTCINSLHYVYWFYCYLMHRFCRDIKISSFSL